MAAIILLLSLAFSLKVYYHSNYIADSFQNILKDPPTAILIEEIKKGSMFSGQYKIKGIESTQLHFRKEFISSSVTQNSANVYIPLGFRAVMEVDWSYRKYLVCGGKGLSIADIESNNLTLVVERYPDLYFRLLQPNYSISWSEQYKPFLSCGASIAEISNQIHQYIQDAVTAYVQGIINEQLHKENIVRSYFPTDFNYFLEFTRLGIEPLNMSFSRTDYALCPNYVVELFNEPKRSINCLSCGNSKGVMISNQEMLTMIMYVWSRSTRSIADYEIPITVQWRMTLSNMSSIMPDLKQFLNTNYTLLTIFKGLPTHNDGCLSSNIFSVKNMSYTVDMYIWKDAIASQVEYAASITGYTDIFFQISPAFNLKPIGALFNSASYSGKYTNNVNVSLLFQFLDVYIKKIVFPIYSGEFLESGIPINGTQVINGDDGVFIL